MAFEPYKTLDRAAEKDAKVLASINSDATTDKLKTGVKNMRTAVRRKYLESLYPCLIFQPYPTIENIGQKSVKITSADGERWVEICCDLSHQGVNGYQYNAKSSHGTDWATGYTRNGLPSDKKRSLGHIFEQIDKIIFDQ